MSVHFTLAGYLDAAAANCPDATAFISPGRGEQSFNTTRARVQRLAAALNRLGLHKGDRLAILAVDSIGYIETILACMAAGIVFVPLNNRLREPEVQVLLQAADPKAVLVSERYAAMAGRIAGQLPGARPLICVDGSAGAIAYEEIIARETEPAPAVELVDDDIAAISFTSGTTGNPKGVLQSQRMLKALVNAAVKNAEINWQSRGYVGPPLFHIAGLAMTMANLATRSSSVILPQFDPSVVLQLINDGQIRHSILVPTMVSMLLDHPQCATTSFESLETVVYGAAPMTAALLQRAIDTFGCDFVQLFGAATEGGLQLILTSRDHRRAIAGDQHLLQSVGRPAIGVSVRIADPEGLDVAPGAVGEIIVQSDQMMSGYLNLPEATQAAFRDGWFWGGDLGRMDAEGYVYLSGRSKDMIIRGGENIYPIEIENIIARCAGVIDVAVLGEADEHWGEVVIACITVDPARCDTGAIIGYCREHLAPHKIPARLEVLDSLPLTGSGKISKPELRALGRGGRADKLGANAIH